MESPTSTTVDGTPLADDALCNSPVKRTHSYLRQRLVMETSIERNAHKCNPQANSPLWNTLPEELRLMIFEAATAQYEDMSRAYKQHENQWRPHHRAPFKTCSNVLLTCRRAWLEAHAFPMRQAELLFWTGYPNHDRMVARWWHNFGSRLTRSNLENIRHVHFMLPIHNMDDICEPGNSIPKAIRFLKPMTFKITSRACDWSGLSWGAPDDYRNKLEEQIRRNVAQLLRVCVNNVKKFQLALEIQEGNRKWEENGPFFDSVRRLRSRVRTIQKFHSDNSYGSYLGVVDEPHSWRRQRPNTNWTTGIVDPKYPELKYRTLELEWVHIRCAINSAGLRIDTPSPTASSHAFSLRSNLMDQYSRGHNIDSNLSHFRRQQDRVRQHSQELSKAFEARCRRAFSEQRIAMETGSEVRRIRAQISLLSVET